MIAFAAVCVLLLLAALAFVLVPLLRPRQADAGAAERSALNLAVHRDQLAELERDLQNGAIGRDQYEQAVAELKARVLEDVAPAEAFRADDSARAPRYGVALAVGIAMPVAAVLLYLTLGTPQALAPHPVVAAGGNPSQEAAQIEAMISALGAKLAANPNDAEGWALLGRTQAAMGRFEPSARAFERALALDDKNPQILADLADSLAMMQGQRLAGRPAQLVEEALSLDPNHPKALALAGAGAFERGDYQAAIAHWEKLRSTVPPGSELVSQIDESIAEARRRGGIAPPAAAAAAPAAKGAFVKGVVKLAPALAAKVAPGDTLFVYARAADGPPMPLAIVRKRAGELPATFDLDDSMAMAPGMSLANFPEVVVMARVSKSGSAMPQSGDLEGATGPIKVGQAGLEVVIDRVRP